MVYGSTTMKMVQKKKLLSIVMVGSIYVPVVKIKKGRLQNNIVFLIH